MVADPIVAADDLPEEDRVEGAIDIRDDTRDRVLRVEISARG
jgi:hypothetical protein